MRRCVSNSVVIPGRREAASPESITTIVSMDSGPAPMARPGMTKERLECLAKKPYAPYTEDFGSGSTGSWVRMLVGHTTVMRSPAFCITTGVERSFWPAIGVSGG